MKKKYITLEEVLALRGTDTKIYTEYNLGYCMFVGDVLCSYHKGGTLEAVGVSMSDNYKRYILEPEEFKVEKTGRYKTREGRTAYVSIVRDNGMECPVCGVIEGYAKASQWDFQGNVMNSTADNDLVEYVGD